MKPYFGKQVIEKPRRGSSNRSLKARHFGRIDEDGEYDGIVHIPMSRHAVDKYSNSLISKDFTDLPGPITRYLFGKIGCGWDAVFSELSEALGNKNWPIRHILTIHLLHRGTLHWYAQGGEFKVKDGLVAFERSDSGYTPREEPVLKVPIKGTDQFYVQIKGIWFIGRYEIEQREYRYMRYYTAEWPDYKTADKIFRFHKTKQASKKELAALKSIIASC